MQARIRKAQVIVRGDIVVDWNIAEGDAVGSGSWSPEKRSGIWRARGGALLLADLLNARLEHASKHGVREHSIHAADLSLDRIAPGDPGMHHASSLLARFPAKGKTTWRVARFLGFDRRSTQTSTADLPDRLPGAALLLLDDANLGFRADPDAWQEVLNQVDEGAWILLKQAAPIAQGRLWDHLIEHHPDRLVTLTTIDDLRRSEVQISRQISWERTAQDVFWEVTHNPRVNSLSRGAHCIISLNAAGAILISNPAGGDVRAQLLFDPYHMECDWENAYGGSMYGYATCLAAAIAAAMIENEEQPDLIAGVQAGVRGIRSLLASGFGDGDLGQGEGGLHFPFGPIVTAMEEDRDVLAVSPIQNPVGQLADPGDANAPRVMPGHWTLLEDRYTRHLNQVAQRVVLYGVDATIQDVPVGRFGALKTVDRREIEALHGLRTLISEYLRRPQARPLSIAVFGPPGSGKSFAVKQIAKSSEAGGFRSITFNISQFDRPEALLDALHQVRDIGLSGAVPLVFWDEFDTPLAGNPLGWLRHFLSPMQDGSFQEGQITHPIGRAIFVFAGGTSHRMEAFGDGLAEVDRRAAKLPDFISRLKGFINILGPNAIEGVDDPHFILRRAIMLRVLLEMHVPQILASGQGGRRLRIDPGVLRAFLETSRYKHGVRSIETLLTMSSLANAESFDRSCLPPEDQLNLHVDGTDFLARVQQLTLEHETLESLARAAHELFCEGLVEQGYTYAAATDRKQRTHRALVDYAELDETLKESNRETVRDIPNKLAAAGYAMLPARSNEPPFSFSGQDLERLARMEHERWLGVLRRSGREPATDLDQENMEHPALAAWEELDEDEREKDRQMVRAIPKILARAGYAVVRTHA